MIFIGKNKIKMNIAFFIFFISFYGSWDCINSEPVVDFQIQCDNSNLSPTWNVSSTEQYVSDRSMIVSFADSNCNSSVNSLTNATEENGFDILSMSLPYSSCGSTITSYPSYITINNTAILKVTDILRGGVSERDFYYKYTMFCQITRNLSLTPSNSNGGFSVIKGENGTNKFNLTVEYGMQISMNFYTDATLTTKQPAGELSLTIQDKVYVKIEESVITPKYKFIVNKCDAVPSLTSNTTAIKDTFFDKGCSYDPTFERLESASAANDSFGFEYQVFYFRPETSDSAVYLRCHVYVCQVESTTDKCQQTCKVTGNRQRRDANRMRYGLDDVEEMTVESTTKISLRQIACADITCPVNTVCFDFKPAKCICVKGYVYSRIEEECQKERISQIDNVHLDQVWNPVYLNTESFEFHLLAEKYEDILYKSFVAAGKYDIIEGVRVIGAKQGSIILETKIIYRNNSSPVEAYKAFVESLESESLESSTVKEVLKFKPNEKPVLKMKIDEEITSVQQLYIIIIVVLVISLIFFVTFFLFVCIRRRRRQNEKGTGYVWFR